MFRRLLIALALPCLALAQNAALGSVNFPTTGAPEAQAHFLRGLAALHSFWFEEALREFQESTKAAPGYQMGYWGEAMAYNHPLWAEQDTEAARKALQKIKDTDGLTAREQAFIGAVRALYGEGDKLTRDKAYSGAMEKVYRDYPNDLEAACFYALSLLGTVRGTDKGFRRQVQAGAIALDVYAKNPMHPGAAHYIIHAFDDPEHAIVALPAARRYAEIAPEAFHARHMPSHIFLQLGMWPEAASSNESSWAASDAWVKRAGLSLAQRDYHSLSWLLYVYTQQGRFKKAEETLALMRRAVEGKMGDPPGRPNYSSNILADMAATYIVNSGRWDLDKTLLPTAAPAMPEGQGGEHARHAGPPNTTLAAFVRGLAEGSDDISKDKGSVPEIQNLEVRAVAASKQGKSNEAIELLKKATAIEEDMAPPSGPPRLIKPSHELLGEILLSAGKPKEAAQQFQIALQRQPNRALSLLGAARAAAKGGDRAAATEAYNRFLIAWDKADPGLPELREAREYSGAAVQGKSTTDVSQFSWMSGCWLGETGGRQVEECWTRPSGGSLLGSAKTVRGGKTTGREFMEIGDNGDGLAFTNKLVNGEIPNWDRPTASFKLLRLEGKEAIFEDPQREFPRRVIYRLTPDGMLVGRIEGTRDGKALSDEVPMKPLNR